jgi:hypothetical protein
MNINATFFLQLINFYVFYWMLRIFLFKPSIDAIDQEHIVDTMLAGIVDQQKKSIEIKEKEHQRSWYLCREYCKQQSPDLSVHTNFLVDDTEAIHPEQELSSQPQDNAPLIEHVYTKLEEKIKHVH